MQVDAVGLYGQEFDFEKRERSQPGFQGAIFSPHNVSEKFSRQAVVCANRSDLDHKVERTFLNSSHGKQMMVTRNRGGGSVALELSFDFGGKESKVEVGVKTEAHDNKGNYVEAQYSHSSKDGSNVSGGVGTDRSSSNDRSSNTK